MNRPAARMLARTYAARIAPLAALVAVAGTLHAETVVLVPIADTTLNEAAPDSNLGGHDRLLAGIDGMGRARHALMLFDLGGGVPAGATIDSATLALVVPGGNTSGPSTFVLHRVLAAWGEGTGTGPFGENPAVGNATWNSRRHGIALWTNAGGDYASVPSADAQVASWGTFEWTGLAGDVQYWLDHPAENFGWLLASDSPMPLSGRQFGAREAGGQLVPQLKIDYTPIPEPATLVLAASGGVLLLVAAARRRRRGAA
jgi:hypothetical protein